MKEEPTKKQVANADAGSKFATEYLFGHPLINKSQMVYLLRTGNDIGIIERTLYHNEPPFVELGTIPLNAIVSVAIEDHSEIEKKFSLGKYMLAGAYALAFPKHEKVNRSYLVICWRIESLESEAVFMNEGDNAAKNMQQVRNVFLHWAATAKQ